MTPHGLACSIDGHWFQFTAGVGAGLDVGGYVRLDVDGDASYLGQIIDIAAGQPGPEITEIRGQGAIRAVTAGNGIIGGAAAAFGSARLAAAESEIVQAHLDSLRAGKAGLQIGTMRRVAGGLPATLQAAGFGRHTLVCGQSGSGKTYSLGAILERLLLETDLRIAVLDPNSDYVGLGRFRKPGQAGADSAAHAAIAERYQAAVSGLGIHGARPGQKPLRSRFGRLPIAQQALVLNLDPIRDASEYNVFRRIVREIGTTEYTLGDVRQRAASMFDDGSRHLAIRIENLDVEDLVIWAPTGEPAMADLVPEDWRALVFDLGSLPSSGERSMMGASIVAHFWSNRHDRRPTLLVIDEAHNVCPQSPADRFQAMASEDLAAIAAEGRKFGLYLLLVTQRPQKLHVNVLSQCENLVLMRMNSASDIDHLATVFSHVPAPLIRQAASFELGQGLAAGRISGDPLLFQTGSRYSVEGGGDIPSTWALPRGF
ncbi:ATP-binding protein [Rhodosalinus sp. FB01]|uniref:ATP-binding protein n=1 Tax=Rhodosalinus sp. FB01 TaxID=3239194 RepID=UPI00352365CD